MNGRKPGGTNRRTERCIATLLWMQGEREPVTTAQVEGLIKICRSETRRVLLDLEACGCIRRSRHPGSGGAFTWEAVGIDEALAAVVAACGETGGELPNG